MKKFILVFSSAVMAVSVLGASRGQTLQSSGNIATVSSSADIITSVEGKEQNMTSVGSGYYVYWYELTKYQDRESASRIVYGDNDEVYFYDLVPGSSYGSYVKGVKNGDKIEISLPQTVAYLDDLGSGVELCLLEMSSWGQYVPSGATSVTLTVSEDGSMTVESLSENLILGLAYESNSAWAQYGASSLSMSPFNDVLVDLPADIPVEKDFWAYNAGQYGWFVNWGKADDGVYFQGLSTSLPEAWIKGDVTYGEDSAIISIPQNEYIGMYEGVYQFTKCAKLVIDEYGQVESGEFMPDDYAYELIWNYADNTVKAKDADVALLVNGSKDKLACLDYFTDVKLKHQDGLAGVPANPLNLEFIDTDYWYDKFIFDVPAISTEGNLLDSNALYYVVYVDGEEWTFDSQEYDTDGDIVEVPWNLDLYYIYNWGGSRREVDFFLEGISTLGVQSVYRYGGEETRSEKVVLDLNDSGVHAVADRKVREVKFYDLSGHEVSKPSAGVFVKKVVFDDGSVANYKLIAH